MADVEAKDAEINRQQKEIQTLTVRKQSTIYLMIPTMFLLLEGQRKAAG